MSGVEELTERQRYWRDHLAACEASGQTTKAYAKAHGLSISMMYSWRRKLVRRGVWSKRSNLTGGSGFTRVRISDAGYASGTWHLVLPNGVQIGFTGAVDEAALDAVLQVAHRL
jgi:hypothetical protein